MFGKSSQRVTNVKTWAHFYYVDTATLFFISHELNQDSGCGKASVTCQGACVEWPPVDSTCHRSRKLRACFYLQGTVAFYFYWQRNMTCYLHLQGNMDFYFYWQGNVACYLYLQGNMAFIGNGTRPFIFIYKGLWPVTFIDRGLRPLALRVCI